MIPISRTIIFASLVFILGILIQFSSFFNYPLASKSAIMATKPLSEISAERAVELRKSIFDQPASTFTNNPWALAEAIEDFANQVGHMMIFRKSKVNVAREQLLAQQPAPRTIVEFGTFVGKSALAWAAVLREIHGEKIPEDVNIYTFDPDAQMVALTREFVKLAGVEDFVHVLQGPGSDSLKTLYAEGKVSSVDMAFFDHWEKFYLSDLKLIEELKLWRVGSLAIADNTDFPGAPDYLEYVQAGGSGESGSVKYETKSFETTVRRGGPVRFVSNEFPLGVRLTGRYRASSR
jgi:catechol O-methyltransferase